MGIHRILFWYRMHRHQRRQSARSSTLVPVGARKIIQKTHPGTATRSTTSHSTRRTTMCRRPALIQPLRQRGASRRSTIRRDPQHPQATVAERAEREKRIAEMSRDIATIESAAPALQSHRPSLHAVLVKMSSKMPPAKRQSKCPPCHSVLRLSRPRSHSTWTRPPFRLHRCRLHR